MVQQSNSDRKRALKLWSYKKQRVGDPCNTWRNCQNIRQQLCEGRGNRRASSTLPKQALWTFGTLTPSFLLQEECAPLLKLKHSHTDSSFAKPCYSIWNTEPSLLPHFSDGLVQKLPVLPVSFWQILIFSLDVHSETSSVYSSATDLKHSSQMLAEVICAFLPY